jgi:light-regulated signal transduction histidine kinase (bacteriophytochrome)
MSAFSEMLAEKYGGKLDAEADQILGFIKGASIRMSTLVRDLLAYARLTTEEERPRRLLSTRILRAALTHLTQAIEESGAMVTHDPMPTLQVDRGQMVRLFQNLIGNAVKYRKPGQAPQVHISAEQKGCRMGHIDSRQRDWLRSQYASDIFAPFQTLAHRRGISGTGVGLAILPAHCAGAGWPHLGGIATG